MKKNKKLIILIAIILIAGVFIFITLNKNNEGNVNIYDNDIGNIEDEENDDNTENGKVDSEEKKQEEDRVNFGGGQSIYLEQMDARTKQAFVEIRNAATNGLKDVQLETIITTKDLNRIMNILLIDMPEVMGLSNNYSYKADNAGNVTSVRLNYFLTQDKIKEFNRERLSFIRSVQSPFSDDITLKSDIILDVLSKNQSPSYVSNISMSSLESLIDRDEKNSELNREEFVKFAQQHIHKINDGSVLSSGKIEYMDGIDYNGYKSIINSNITGMSERQLPNLKNKIEVLRSLGFDASIVGGEFIAYDLIPKDESIDNFKFIEAKKLIKESKNENGYIDVSVDPYNYYFWIVVNIDNNYYIHDDTLSQMLNFYVNGSLNDPLVTGKNSMESFYKATAESFIGENLFELVPDYIAAGTRIMYYNEELLGMPPASRTFKYSSIADREEYISSSSLSDLKGLSNSFIDHIIKESTTGDIHFRIFKNSEDMTAFAKFFKDGFDDYNIENKNTVKEYKVKELPVVNMIIVYNILK